MRKAILAGIQHSRELFGGHIFDADQSIGIIIMELSKQGCEVIQLIGHGSADAEKLLILQREEPRFLNSILKYFEHLAAVCEKTLTCVSQYY